MLSHLKNIFMQFVYIIAGNTIGVTLYIFMVSGTKTISTAILWQIILVAAICALGYLILIVPHEISKKFLIVRQIIHYLYINTIILGSARLFDWMNLNSLGILLSMILIIAIIYISMITIIFLQDSQTADRVNKKLRAFRSEDET